MLVLSALAILLSAVAVIVFLAMAIFRKPRSRFVKRAGYAFLAMIGLAVAVGTMAPEPSTPTAAAQRIDEPSEGNLQSPVSAIAMAADEPTTPPAEPSRPPRPPEVEPRSEAEQQLREVDAFCFILDQSGILAAPCERSLWRASITITVDTSSAEARKICSGMPGMLDDLGLTRVHGWTLNIKSPYSGDNTISFCTI